MKLNPRLFFSFRSPFSWLAVKRLLAALPDADRCIEFIPYWEPDPWLSQKLAERGARIHYVAMSKAKHRYILQDTKRLAASLNLKIVWPVDVEPYWELSHLAWLKARRLGAALPFYVALTDLRWLHGANISDTAVIRAAAECARLDPDSLVAASDDEEIRHEGLDCLTEAYEDDIFGVPYLRYGHHRFWGFDRVDAFVSVFQNSGGSELIETVTQEPQALADVSIVGDFDTAGGCG